MLTSDEFSGQRVKDLSFVDGISDFLFVHYSSQESHIFCESWVLQVKALQVNS